MCALHYSLDFLYFISQEKVVYFYNISDLTIVTRTSINPLTAGAEYILGFIFY